MSQVRTLPGAPFPDEPFRSRYGTTDARRSPSAARADIAHAFVSQGEPRPDTPADLRQAHLQIVAGGLPSRANPTRSRSAALFLIGGGGAEQARFGMTGEADREFGHPPGEAALGAE